MKPRITAGKLRPVLFLAIAITAVAVGFGQPGSEAHSPDAGNAPPNPVLVELFTSEGCSSCPPADILLAVLERLQPVPNAQIITLSEHVDYWNYLGWKDPYSSAQFSNRQGGYSRTLRQAPVLTPQMIVDGREVFVGSDGPRAQKAVARAAEAPKANIRITRPREDAGSPDKTVPLTITVEGLPDATHGRVDVMLAIREHNLRNSVRRGENAGKQLKHQSVVRHLSRVGTIHPQKEQVPSIEASVELNPEWDRNHLQAVVFLQERKTRRIMGAAVEDLAVR